MEFFRTLKKNLEILYDCLKIPFWMLRPHSFQTNDLKAVLKRHVSDISGRK